MISFRILTFVAAAMLFFCDLETAEAQGPIRNSIRSGLTDIKEFKRDYKFETGFQYAPNDPWYRSKIFRMHTGHWGRFYNCDGEEAKRNSPYLIWRQHCEPDFPTRKGLRNCLGDEIDRVYQRVRDGACCDEQSLTPNNGCAHCNEGCAVCQAQSENRAQDRLPTRTARKPVKDSGLLNR